MEIKNSSYVAPVTQNVKTELVKKSIEETAESVSTTATLQDDIVTLSTTAGGHPERPPKP